MLCPNCKNPIEENTIICEWCGVHFASKEQEKTTEQAELNNDLDMELISLLTNGKKSQALKLYKEYTGCSTEKSLDYINRLKHQIARKNFFLKHKGTTEKIWQEHVENLSNTYIGIRFLQVMLLLISICIAISSLPADPNERPIASYLRLSIVFIIISIFFWIGKTKKPEI
jgi:uncharacterized Zn finger protein (UPF0148 family)